MKIAEIWCEFEDTDQPFDPENGQSDVVAETEDGKRYAATFFTYSRVAQLMEQDRISGQCLGGTYFCARDCIIVRRIDRQTAEKVMYNLAARGEIALFCRKV